MKSKIITIAGALGSGKSSTAKLVAQELGYKHFSSGDLFRAMAAERNITIEEINERAELEQEIDHAVDERLRQMANEGEFVIDSRMAFHWMPNSFKVFLSLDPHAAAERIHAQIQKEGRASQSGESVEQIYTETIRRKESEIRRYTTLYNIDIYDVSQYDAVVDTQMHDLKAVAALVIAQYRAWLEA